MEPIIAFRDKSLWSRNNNRANIWFCSQENKLNKRTVLEWCSNEPVFIFHPSVLLPQAICDAFDWDDNITVLTAIEKAIENGRIEKSIDKPITTIKFSFNNWGEITIKSINS